MSSAEDIAALLMQPQPEREPMGALAMAQAARASLATQPARLEHVPVSYSPEAAASADAAAMSPETYVNPAVRGVMGSLAEIAAGPGNYAKPNPYPAGSEEASWYEDQRQKGGEAWARDAAMTMMGGGVPMAEKGAAGIFGGRLAQTADLNALQKAKKMSAAGAPREAVHAETGWFQGPDQKWRFEISDDKARLNPNFYGAGYDEMPTRGQFGPIAGQVWHPDLYSAYPDLRRATGYFEKDSGSGSYQAAEHSPTGEETIKASGPDVDTARSVALHELQHAIQEREGFASGGSPSMFSQGSDAELARTALSYRRELEGLDPHLTPKQKDEIVRKRYEEVGAPDWFPSQEAREVAHDVEGNPPDTLQRVMQLYGTDTRTSPIDPKHLYRELPGEVEARNVQTRRDLTPQERQAQPPWTTLDVQPREIMNQIFGNGTMGILARSRP